MNIMKLSSLLYRWFRYEILCFLTSKCIPPCLCYGNLCCVSCKVYCYTKLVGCTCICTMLFRKLYIKGVMFVCKCSVLVIISHHSHGVSVINVFLTSFPFAVQIIFNMYIILHTFVMTPKIHAFLCLLRGGFFFQWFSFIFSKKMLNSCIYLFFLLLFSIV